MNVSNAWGEHTARRRALISLARANAARRCAAGEKDSEGRGSERRSVRADVPTRTDSMMGFME